MKTKFLLPAIAITMFVPFCKTLAQNADEIIFNQYLAKYNYVAASFLIDTGTSQANAQKRAFLIWANNLQPDTLKRNLSLSEYDNTLNFLTEQGNATEKIGSVKNMFPKKIIKSKFEKAYYLLAYVSNSTHTIGGFKVYSSPMIFKIDATTLGLKWARKIHLSSINKATAKAVIEYNDIIETRDKNVVVVGKYATNTQSKERILATKLRGTNGAIVWRYIYNTGNACNEGANSVAETTDGNLSLTGYVRKCVVGQTLTGNADVFYMQLQATGVPAAGAYVRYYWPTNLNIWGDKITRYTSSAGNDQLIISGYIDVLNGNVADRQILIMNLKQSGALLSAQHIGNIGVDVCNDLLFKKESQTGTDYAIYLTGQTNSTQTASVGMAYFLAAKFNAGTGVTGISEFSIFPNSTYSKGARIGLEIKNAGNYKKFAILATGTYQPAAGTNATYSNVLLRDFGDATGNCIKILETPIKQFSIDRSVANVFLDSPSLKLYKEDWNKLEKLFVKEPCQQIKIDPSDALNLQQSAAKESKQLRVLQVSPNPANSVITLSTTDGKNLCGNNKEAVVRIYNAVSRVERIITISQGQNNLRIPVSQLIPGMYRIQLVRGDETLSCSFIKE